MKATDGGALLLVKLLGTKNNNPLYVLCMFLNYANGTKSRKASNILKTSNQSKLIYIINNHAPVYFFFKKISTKLQSKKNGIYKR